MARLQIVPLPAQPDHAAPYVALFDSVGDDFGADSSPIQQELRQDLPGCVAVWVFETPLEVV